MLILEVGGHVLGVLGFDVHELSREVDGVFAHTVGGDEMRMPSLIASRKHAVSIPKIC